MVPKYRSKGGYRQVADLSMGYAVNKVTLWSKEPELPGCSPDIGGLLRIKAAAPIKPAKPQQPCDVGLFSDEADQLDLCEMFQDQPEDGL